MVLAICGAVPRGGRCGSAAVADFAVALRTAATHSIQLHRSKSKSYEKMVKLCRDSHRNSGMLLKPNASLYLPMLPNFAEICRCWGESESCSSYSVVFQSVLE